MTELSERVSRLEGIVEEIKKNDEKQNEQIDSIKADTSELVEIFRAGEGTAKALKWFGKVVVWMGSVASGVYAIWFALTHWPPYKGG